MWIRKNEKRGKLAQEALGLFGASIAVSIFFFGFLSTTSDSIVFSYCNQNGIYLTEIQQWTVDSWINNISFLASVLLFVILFLFLMGQKLSYLREIIGGIHALRLHRMEHEIPVQGENEFTELAESINYLAVTERKLLEKEAALKAEKEQLIRALSHDIRTPLTAILSYSEYVRTKDTLSRQEMDDYICLMQQKAEQIKVLTDRLLDEDKREPEYVEQGRFLMEQLVDEWTAGLEDAFRCEIDLGECPEFSGEYDIAELRRIFDNLLSNIRKYAEPEHPVTLNVWGDDGYIVMEQKNICRKDLAGTESYGIGIESIRRIAGRYEGDAAVFVGDAAFTDGDTERSAGEEFSIRIRIKARISETIL